MSRSVAAIIGRLSHVSSDLSRISRLAFKQRGTRPLARAPRSHPLVGTSAAVAGSARTARSGAVAGRGGRCDRARAAAAVRSPRLRRGSDRMADGVGRKSGAHAVVAPRWPRVSVRAPDPADRAAGDLVRPLLPDSGAPAGPLLPAADAVHRGHAGRGAGGKSPADVRVLGAHQHQLVPAHRLSRQENRSARGRAYCACGHRRGRARAACRRAAAGPHRRQLRTRRGARCRRSGEEQCSVFADSRAGAGRRVHQVRADPVPLLAAGRDGCAHPGVGLPAFGDHGEGGDFPAGASVSGAGRTGCLVLYAHRCGRVDVHLRCVPGGVPARSEKPARLLDAEPPRPHRSAAGDRNTAWRRRRAVSCHQSRHVQGLAVHGRRHHRPRDRHTRHAPHQWPVAVHALYRCARCGGGGCHGGCAADERFPVQGDVLRRGARPEPGWRPAVDPASYRSAGWCVQRGVLAALHPRCVLPRSAAGCEEDSRTNRRCGCAFPWRCWWSRAW